MSDSYWVRVRRLFPREIKGRLGAVFKVMKHFQFLLHLASSQQKFAHHVKKRLRMKGIIKIDGMLRNAPMRIDC